jgi:Bax protein
MDFKGGYAVTDTMTDRKRRRLGGLLLIWVGSVGLGAVFPVWLAFQLAAPQPGFAALPQPDMQLRLIAEERQLVRIVGRVPVERARDIFSLYDYDLEAVREGELVPPIFVRAMPSDIAELTDTDLRKQVFVETVLPLVLRVNAEIANDRKRLLHLIETADGDLGAVTMRDRRWLGNLAARYGMEDTDLAELQRRVDIVPPSLAVAQAANESGWGTSRFAQLGNALYVEELQGMIRFNAYHTLDGARLTTMAEAGF